MKPIHLKIEVKPRDKAESEPQTESPTEAKSEVEELWKEIHTSISQSDLDAIDVERTHAPGEGSANEPVTIAITLGIPTVAITVGIVRIIEKWLENRRQANQLELLLEGAAVVPEAVSELRALAEKHSDVSLNIKPATARDVGSH